MTLKSFKECLKLDLSGHIKKKPTFKKNPQTGKLQETPKSQHLDYLEWATVITLLYENGATDVRFGSYRNKNGYPAFFDENGKNPFVRVWVRVDHDFFEMDFPVINGNKAESNPDQLSIHKAQQRGMVKAVAINTGLGLPLWQSEEEVFDKQGINKDNGKNERSYSLKTKRQEFKAVLDTYQDTDKEDYRKMAVEKYQKGEDSIEFYNRLIKQMKGGKK